MLTVIVSIIGKSTKVDNMLIGILLSILILIIGLLLYMLLNPPVTEDYYRDQSGLVELEMYVNDLQKKPPLI